MKMKSVLKLLGIVAAVAVIGFSVMGCDNDSGCFRCYTSADSSSMLICMEDSCAVRLQDPPSSCNC